MKALRIVTVSLGIVAPSALLASEFSDFRIPEHRWYSASGSVSGLYGSSSYRHDFGDARYQSGGGSTAFSGSWLTDGDDRRYFLGLSTSASVSSRLERRSEFGTSGFDPYDRSLQRLQRQDERLGGESWAISGDARHYLGSSPLGLGLRGAAVGQYQQSWREWELEATDRDSSGTFRLKSVFDQTYRYYDIRLSGTGTIGFGRVRNATGVYQALLLERRLRADRAISALLSREAREKIAALYYVRPQYQRVHDRPNRYFWRDVEDILREDGALSGDGWDAYDLFHANEGYVFPATGGSPLRLAGYYVGASVGAVGAHQSIRIMETMDQRTFRDDSLVAGGPFTTGSSRRTKSDFVSLGAEAEFHRPIGLRWQLDLSSRVLTPSRDFFKIYEQGSLARLHYLVADRWSATGFMSHNAFFYKDPELQGASHAWGMSYGVTLGTYLEDRLELQLSASGSQTRSKNSFHPRPWATGVQYSRGGSVSLGLSYRFLGVFEAPGLIPPVRSLPVGAGTW